MGFKNSRVYRVSDGLGWFWMVLEGKEALAG